MVFLAIGLSAGLGCRQSSEEALQANSTEVLSATVSKGPRVQPASHTKMLMRLRQIADKAPTEHPWLGSKNVEVWKNRLAAMDPQTNFKHWLIGYVRLAREEAKQGSEADAIDTLTKAYELLPKLSGKIPLEAENELRYRLALAYLRLGESQNCCAQNTADSCIMPIRGEGIHRRRQGSKQAIQFFEEVLANASTTSPVWLKSKWLLNLAHMTIEGYPHDVPHEYRISPDVFNSDEAWPRFVNVAPKMDLETFNLLGGVIVDDFNGDLHLDIMASTYDPTGQMRCFLSNGDGSFNDATEESQLAGILGGINMEQADYNNDGHVDIFVFRGAWCGESGRHPNSLLRNNGDGTFSDVTFAAGLESKSHPTQTGAWADYDNDGYLDLYVGNEHYGDVHAPSQLFHNNGDGTFTDVAASAGVENWRFAKGVSWGDYDHDRFPDLYVSNMLGLNRLYHNQGDGTFVDVAEQAGVALPKASFPTWFWDYNNDGHLDIYVATNLGGSKSLANVVDSYMGVSFKGETARLYQGNGSGRFRDVARQANLEQHVLPMGVNFGDLDNDGYLDFYLGTGYPDYEALMPNVMYHNQGGERFADITFSGGFGHLQKGHGIAFADLDNDGDQDVYAQLGGAYPGDRFSDALFENPGSANHWIAVRLIGTQSNRSAIGAQIKVTIDGRDSQIFRTVNSGGSFGANPLRQTIGIGKAENVQRLEIFWPTSGKTQEFHDLPADVLIRIVEDEDEFQVQNLTPVSLH